MIDIFPTVVRLCGATPPSSPLDGIDIWPLLTGQKQSIDRAALLYFDNWDLQCARWMNWKLHIARHNTAAYAPAPAGGRHSYMLGPSRTLQPGERPGRKLRRRGGESANR